MDRWPSIAVELPLRIAVWDGGDGNARVAYLSAEALVAQFEIDPGRAAPLVAPSSIIADLLRTY